MGKTRFFSKTTWKKIAKYNINISIIILTLAVLSADFLLISDPISAGFIGGSSFDKIDTKKANLVLSYLTQLVPPLEIDIGGSGFLSEGDSFLTKPMIIDTLISTLPRENITTYTVSEGETYWTISYKYEIDINTLLWANGISDVNKVEIGKELIILPVNGLLYTTVPGDTVEGVALAFNVPSDKIMAQNKLASNTLIADTQLVLPGARKYVPKPATALPNYAGDNFYYTGPVVLGSGNFGWPIRSNSRFITQYFGWVNKYYKHTGIDLDWRNGTDIIASDSGTVVSVGYGWGGGYGINIIIDHGNGFQTHYSHLYSSLVKIGDNVEKGQSIAVMGSTGRSTGVHLDFEIRQDGVAINPLIYVW